MTVLIRADSPVLWQPAVNLSNTPGRSFQATLAHDPSSGDLFAVWTDDGVGDWEEIMGRRWERSTHTWLPVENLSRSKAWERDSGPALVFDGHGLGLLIWTRTYSASQGAPTSGYDILWRSWDGAFWSSEAVLLHGDSYLPGSPGSFGLIPVETPDGVLLFITWDTGYRTTLFQTGTWTQVSPWTHLDVRLAQVINGEDGLLHAAAYGPNSRQDGFNGHFFDAYHLTYDGVSWSEPRNLSFTDGVADNVGLAFDGQGRLHFLWSDPDFSSSDESLKSAIWQRVYANGDWTSNSVIVGDEPDQAINGFSLTTDVTGTLHLAWSEGTIVDGAHTNLNIYYRNGDGTAWNPDTNVYTSTAASRYPVLVTAKDGPSLIWQEVYEVGSPFLSDHEVFFSQWGSVYRTYLPLIRR